MVDVVSLLLEERDWLIEASLCSGCSSSGLAGEDDAGEASQLVRWLLEDDLVPPEPPALRPCGGAMTSLGSIDVAGCLRPMHKGGASPPF